MPSTTLPKILNQGITKITEPEVKKHSNSKAKKTLYLNSPRGTAFRNTNFSKTPVTVYGETSPI